MHWLKFIAQPFPALRASKGVPPGLPPEVQGQPGGRPEISRGVGAATS